MNFPLDNPLSEGFVTHCLFVLLSFQIFISFSLNLQVLIFLIQNLKVFILHEFGLVDLRFSLVEHLE